MADVKDDNGLKKAEEALKKAEQNPALDGPQDSPKFQAAAQKLLKARANFEAAGGVSDATPAVIEPRKALTLPTPPDSSAPTMENLGGSGQLAPSPLASQSDKIVDQARTAAPLDTTTLLSNPVTIANQAREGKKTPGEKAANKIKRLAKQAAQKKKEAAANRAAYDRGVAERARQSKVDSEAVRAIRERHDKDKPSALEMGLAGLSGGLLGGLMGTYDRYFDSSRAANEEVENFRRKNEHDETIRKALVSAKNTSAGAAAASHGWNASAISAARDASSVLTSNAYSPHLFKEGTPNPLSGIGSNKDGDSKEQVRAWFTKRHTQAIKGNKKAIQEIGAASSRIAGKEELYKPYLQKDLVIADNKDTYAEKLYATVPPLLGEASEVMASIDYMWGDKVALNEQIETWETLNAYHQMFDVLAASAGPEGEYADFAAKWASIKDNPSSPVFKSVAAMKDMAEKFKVTITSQQRNLRDVKDAGRRVTDIKAKIKRLEDNDNHDEAIWERENELPEAEQNLRLTLLFSGHSDLKVRSGEDGGVEVYSTDSEIDFPLLVQTGNPVDGFIIGINSVRFSQEPPERQAELNALGREALKIARRTQAIVPPIRTGEMEEGQLTSSSADEWIAYKDNPETEDLAADIFALVEGIGQKINAGKLTVEEALRRSSFSLTDVEQDVMRNEHARGLIKRFEVQGD